MVGSRSPDPPLGPRDRTDRTPEPTSDVRMVSLQFFDYELVALLFATDMARDHLPKDGSRTTVIWQAQFDSFRKRIVEASQRLAARSQRDE